MRFTPEDATTRYRDTLQRMKPGKMAELGDNWGAAMLAFFFATDRNLAAFSARDTLLPMLQEDRRVLADAIMREFLISVGLDQQASAVADQVFDTYSSSTPIG